MEEKKRYSFLIGTTYIDNETNNFVDIAEVVNQQDKYIKELEESNEPLKKSKAHFKKVAENVVDLLGKLNKFIGEPQTQELNYYKVIEDTKNYIEELKQSRKQLAISELEKVKTKFNGKRPIDELASEIEIELGYTSTQINNFVEN